MSSIINPDNSELFIKGSVDIESSLAVHSDFTLDGTFELTGKISTTDTTDIDLSGDPVTVNYGDGALNVVGGGFIGGNLYVGGTLVANGDVITLGNSGGSVTFNANVSSDIIPSNTEQYDIGSSTNLWRKVYTESLVLDTDPHTIEPTATEITSASSLCYFDENSSTSVALRDQEPGTVKVFTLLSTPVSSIQVTPDTAVGFTDFIMTNAGDSISLIFTSAGWVITSAFRTSVS